MSAAFSPGPWTVGQATYGVRDSREELVALTYGDDPECRPDERMAANARLIAAAPDLLFALEAVLTAYCHEHKYHGCEGWAEVSDARAAIAKALGDDKDRALTHYSEQARAADPIPVGDAQDSDFGAFIEASS